MFRFEPIEAGVNRVHMREDYLCSLVDHVQTFDNTIDVRQHDLAMKSPQDSQKIFGHVSAFRGSLGRRQNVKMIYRA